MSALLEAMAEGYVSVDGVSHALPTPFFVIATQNPGEQVEVHPLPESQLDRFLMRLEIGYPSPQAERRLLAGEGGLHALTPLLDAARMLALQAQARAVYLSDEVIDMILALVEASRADARLRLGLSPRAMLALKAAAQAWALLAAWTPGRQRLDAPG